MATIIEANVLTDVHHVLAFEFNVKWLPIQKSNYIPVCVSKAINMHCKYYFYY